MHKVKIRIQVLNLKPTLIYQIVMFLHHLKKSQ